MLATPSDGKEQQEASIESSGGETDFRPSQKTVMVSRFARVSLQSSHTEGSGSSGSPQRPPSTLDESSTQSDLQSPASSLRQDSRSKQQAVRQPSSISRSQETRETVSIGELAPFEDDSGIYENIVGGRFSPEEVAARLIETYKNDRETALLMLRQFFISSSGCSGRITPEMRGLENAEIIGLLIDKFDSETGEYPLIMTGLKWHQFRLNFGKFLHCLVQRCRNSIIYDQVLLFDARSLLIELSDSKVRAFRHTATAAAMKLSSALAEVAVAVSRNLDIALRQLRSERRRASKNRLENLTMKIEEFQENFAELKENLNVLFSSVYVQRYVDIADEIRVVCIVEMTEWMKIFPEYFVNDRYLKYVGWSLYDIASKVRYWTILALQLLFVSEALKSKLEGFISKFKPRIVAMTLDKDSEVAAQTINLLTSIFIHCSEFLTDEDCESVYKLIYSSNRGVAQAAGIFLKHRLFTLDQNTTREVRSKRGKPRLPNTPLISDLVLFFIEAELLEHGAYLVDSLIDSNPMMKDWECMIDLLLEEPGPEEEPLSNEAETCLIELMVLSIKQTVTGVGPAGRTPMRKVGGKVEQRRIRDDKLKVTEHFIPALPLLLEKYRADPEKLSNLLIVPRYFDLTFYTTLRDEESLQSLLSKISEIVLNSPNEVFLETASKTLEVLCDEDSPTFGRCDVARSLLIDRLVDCYRSAISTRSNRIDSDETPSDDEMFLVDESLKKIAIFYSSHDINKWNVQDSLFNNLAEAENNREAFPAKTVVYCIFACTFSLLWSENRLKNPSEGDATQLEDEAHRLKEILCSFMESLKYFVDGGATNAPASMTIREEAYAALCDLLVVFSGQLAIDSNPLLHNLAYEVDEQMGTTLNQFVQERIFTEIEEDENSRTEELHKRRNLLAGYCKLIIYNIVPVKWAADVFKHYVRFYSDYGDIIKATLVKAKNINKINCALAMKQSLSVLFQEVMAERNIVRSDSNEFKVIKELAKKFALIFSSQPGKNRDAVIALHIAGISSAFANTESLETNSAYPPPDLLLLNALEEFTKLLLKDDRSLVLDYLNSKAPAIVPSSQEEQWQPLIDYRMSLLKGAKRRAVEGNVAVIVGEQSRNVTKSKKKKTRVANKNPLSVTKFTLARGARTASVREDMDVVLTPDSPVPEIDSSSQSSYHDAEDGTESLRQLLNQRKVRSQEKSPSSDRHAKVSRLFTDDETMVYSSD